MKNRYKLFRRGSRFYVEDTESGRQTSLHTADRSEAQRLVAARNEAVQQPTIRLALGRAYLSALDPQLIRRTWRNVFEAFANRGKEQTIQRRRRAGRSPALAQLLERKLVETTGDDLRAVLKDAGTSTNLFLRCLHNLALGLGWIPAPIIPPKLWPQIRPRPKRGVTRAEHEKILASERNPERRSYYAMLWAIGAAQSDGAHLIAANVDWQNRVLSYQRKKTGEWASIQIGVGLEELLKGLPTAGPLFPRIQASSDSARSAEFCRRCRVAGVKGVSLHSYRYSWAERAKAAGYPIRWAQNALGHNSSAVHMAYARGAVVVCPSLESYEGFAQGRSIAPEGAIVEVQQESEGSARAFGRGIRSANS